MKAHLITCNHAKGTLEIYNKCTTLLYLDEVSNWKQTQTNYGVHTHSPVSTVH